ncbi:Lrp/AsnC family transcriptional regulator [Paenibacillus mucilaginosus]|uniref:Transcriptional regulator Lrp/AsnC n=3 Tax=Paenibacillus mucilaginosus TaxID=61624 RepID=H6NPI5_9BACL|nr:Lrp/AsnC family transcriptional regulator [Paenibacillus mucilaginosus]AEI44845.1 Transcriptional regulator, Lrp/AsnC [Paenibacillus mucilaginosus KNP414]AFC32597.1 transcriptional regulator Lrp/AsnC [Paenibacillus mucilaginosus 3016]MCG7214891.1 Lrp/AsnC family transcriptional regulator [Paenibacillus mucilaginosus]WDM26369.1 Lrp/AsnC family transcriptional regulator [Paenibacillus mucilaginosus]WFA21075.1 Lrp/AsnC family transcriptional regulator [Paenibacillus mucilaginosus]
MDAIDIALLKWLQEDGRMTVSELSKKLSLSRPSISERLLRLQEKGVIEGFSAKVSPAAVGRSTVLMIQMSELKLSYHDFEQKMIADPDIIECHRVTGTVDYIMKAAVGGVDGLSLLVERLMLYGSPHTSVIIGSPVAGRPILPREKK